MATYKDLILQHCAGIVEQVLNNTERYRVGSGKIPVPKEPILYRWWFPFNSKVVTMLGEWRSKDSKEPTNLLKGVETREFEGEIYYALYFGKSNNGYRRFCQHSTGNVHISTLRRTIHSLLTDDAYNKSIHEPEITNLLKACYFEWTEISQEEANLVECLEALCIVHGVYPLNIDGNSAINENWLKYMMKERGKVKDNNINP